MDPMHERVEELTQQMIERVNKAELALNRHGFTQDERGDWKAPGMPNWAGALELRDYLMMHFPDIASQPGSLNQKATRALIEADKRRNDAASEWIRSSLPSIRLEALSVNASTASLIREAEARGERKAQIAQVEQSPAQEHEPADPQPAPAIFRVIWPDPKTMNFTLNDRRDPFNLAERHTELRRRSTDLDED